MNKKEIKNNDMNWKQLVYSKYKVCAICGKDKHLQAHHLISRRIRKYRWSEINGILLCSGCHQFSLKNSPHTNPFQFFEWLKKNSNEQYQFIKDNSKYEKE